MSHPAPHSRSDATWLRRHWPILAVIACTAILVLLGRPAWAADGRIEVNQTVPPPTPEDPGEPPPEPTPQPAAAPSPSVSVQDQTSDGASVMVPNVVAVEDGWLVIHVDQDGGPGSVLGQTAVPAGATGNVVVFLDPPLAATSRLWAMLHVDAGNIGVYEFPGPDAPVRSGDQIVMLPFTASVETPAAVAAAPATDTAAEAATPAPTEEPAEAVEATPEVTEMATEEAPEAVETEMAASAATPETAAATPEAAAAPAESTAAEAAAPQQLPATGGDSGLLALAVAGLVVLAGGSLVLARRRVV